MADDPLVEDMMALVHRQADIVLAKPREEREATFGYLLDLNHRAGLGSDMTEAQARDNAAKMDEFVRALVRMIDVGGSPQGGHC